MTALRRVKADAYLHAQGKPLRARADAAAAQLALPDFGVTYRERLIAAEREIAWQRLASRDMQWAEFLRAFGAECAEVYGDA